MEEAEEIVVDKHKRVYINKVGIFVLDDVDGLSGFTDFLGIIYEEENKEEAYNVRAWAKSISWSISIISNKMII